MEMSSIHHLEQMLPWEGQFMSVHRTAHVLIRGKICFVELRLSTGGLWEARGTSNRRMIVAEGLLANDALLLWRDMAGG